MTTLSQFSHQSSSTSSQHAVKLCWSKVKNHTKVAAGFSNGTICVWNLSTNSTFLMSSDKKEIYPILTFEAHQYTITMLRMHGESYLMSGSLDRKIKVFNLDDGAREMSCLAQKSQISCGDWGETFSFPFFSCDTDFCFNTSELRGMLMATAKNDDRMNVPFITTNSTITDVAFNPWTNVVGMTTVVGDCLFFHLPDYFLDSKPRARNSVKIVSGKIIEKKENIEVLRNFFLQISTFLDEVRSNEGEKNDLIGNSEPYGAKKILFNDLDKVSWV